METLIEKYGLGDAAAMLLAALRIVRIPADVAAWLFDAEPPGRAFERNVVLAARERRRHKYDDMKHGPPLLGL